MAILTANFHGNYVSSVNGLDGDVYIDLYNASNIHEAKTPIINEMSNARTASLIDQGSLIRFKNAAASSYTIPLNSSVAFEIGVTISLIQAGAGQVTLIPEAGVTLNTEIGLKTTNISSFITLIKVGVNEWDVTGSTSA